MKENERCFSVREMWNFGWYNKRLWNSMFFIRSSDWREILQRRVATPGGLNRKQCDRSFCVRACLSFIYFFLIAIRRNYIPDPGKSIQDQVCPQIDIDRTSSTAKVFLFIHHTHKTERQSSPQSEWVHETFDLFLFDWPVWGRLDVPCLTFVLFSWSYGRVRMR